MYWMSQKIEPSCFRTILLIASYTLLSWCSSISSNKTVMSISPSGRYSLVAKEPKYYTFAVGYFSKIIVLTLHIRLKVHIKDGKSCFMLFFWGFDIFIKLNNLVMESQNYVLHLFCWFGKPWVSLLGFRLLYFLYILRGDRFCLNRVLGCIESDYHGLLFRVFVELYFLGCSWLWPLL